MLSYSQTFAKQAKMLCTVEVWRSIWSSVINKYSIAIDLGYKFNGLSIASTLHVLSIINLYPVNIVYRLSSISIKLNASSSINCQQPACFIDNRLLQAYMLVLAVAVNHSPAKAMISSPVEI